jgi:Ala-tRNA(Pro) deacylase
LERQQVGLRMQITSTELLSYLAELGIATSTTHHPPVRTVAEAQRLRGQTAGTHTKNLFLRDAKRNYFMVCLEENTEVDLKQLRLLVGARGGLSFGSPEALHEKLGVMPGAVSPLCAINDKSGSVTFVLERKLLSANLLSCHPLANDCTTSLPPDHLLIFLRETNHKPQIISVNADGGCHPS